MVWTHVFGPFGETLDLNEDADGDEESVTLNLRSPGQYYDAESGLNYNWHRFYDPVIGQFLQPEYYQEHLLDSEWHQNIYSYNFSNPIVNIDTSGEYPGCRNLTDEEKDKIRQALSEINNKDELSGCAGKIAECGGDAEWLDGMQICPGQKSPGRTVGCFTTWRDIMNVPIDNLTCAVVHESCHCSNYGFGEECSQYKAQENCLHAKGITPSKQFNDARSAACEKNKKPDNNNGGGFCGR